MDDIRRENSTEKNTKLKKPGSVSAGKIWKNLGDCVKDSAQKFKAKLNRFINFHIRKKCWSHSRRRNIRQFPGREIE